MSKETRLREFSGKGALDDQVHLVDAGGDALLDPSPYRTRCGQQILEVYNTAHKVTCPKCAKD